ncbi:MAG: hypothetical protein H6811_10130 [Phycisphaeraceae bacterium]|nr:hypothetical protein [Phycisphaeraceae bacterium]
MNTRRFSLALPLIGLIVAAGCQSAPRGTNSGRVDVGWSTPAEAADARPLPDDLVAFSDQWAESLMRDLSDLPELSDTPYQVTLLYGDIQNRTDIVSTNEFETIRERMKDNLLKSRTFRDRFRFLVSRAQLDELRRREVNTPTNPNRFDEQNTYLINGTMSRIGRGDTHYYYMNFKLMNFSSGEEIWSERYEGKRVGR